MSDRVVELLSRPGATFEEVAPLVRGAEGRRLLETGDMDAGLFWAGQVQGLIHDVPSVADPISGHMAEAVDLVRQRLNGLIDA